MNHDAKKKLGASGPKKSAFSWRAFGEGSSCDGCGQMIENGWVSKITKSNVTQIGKKFCDRCFRERLLRLLARR